MKVLSNYSIGHRLIFSFAAIIILAIISTSFALLNAKHAAAATQKMMKEPLAKERVINDWYTYNFGAVARATVIAKSTDDTLTQAFSKINDENVKMVSTLVKKLEGMQLNDKEKAMIKEIADVRANYLEKKNKVLALKKSGTAEAVEAYFEKEFVPATQLYQQKLKDLRSLEQDEIDALGQSIQKENDQSFVLSITLLVFIVALASVMGYLVAVSVTRPLRNAVMVAQTVASRDLTTAFDTHTKDEIGALMKSLESMNESLKSVVSEIQVGTASIETASHEIASGNLDLSSRTEQQAASLEETASSMEEITSAVKHNADNSQQANHLSKEAGIIAANAGDVVNRVVATMSAINESSKKMTDIIGVIDGIAFQTNILALNAAVEAARAGEQGRGFAVVATEVRSLAGRSAAAAKEIKDLIDKSAHQVQEGTVLVKDAGVAMQDVVSSVNRVTSMVNDISVASQEQRVGIEQVNQSIAQMDGVTQQNAALVEEAAAAAESLNDQAEKLAQMARTFKLAGGSSGASGRLAPAQSFDAVRAGSGASKKAAASLGFKKSNY